MFVFLYYKRSSSTHVDANNRILSFLWLNRIPLCMCTFSALVRWSWARKNWIHMLMCRHWNENLVFTLLSVCPPWTHTFYPFLLSQVSSCLPIYSLCSFLFLSLLYCNAFIWLSIEYTLHTCAYRVLSLSALDTLFNVCTLFYSLIRGQWIICTYSHNNEMACRITANPQFHQPPSSLFF